MDIRKMAAVAVAFVLLAAGGAASADTITGLNLDRGNVKSDIWIPYWSPIYGVFSFHMGYVHNYTNGTGTLSGYNGEHIGFCGDLQSVHPGDVSHFTLAPVTSAPVPAAPPGNGSPDGNPYTAAEADHLNAWMTASLQLGLVDSHGFLVNTSHTIGANTYSGDDVARAVQFGVWNSLWDLADGNAWLVNTGDVYLVGPSASVINCVSDIGTVAAGKLGDPMITQMLTDPIHQDMVVLVPEPATLSLLALGGLAMIRRRKP